MVNPKRLSEYIGFTRQEVKALCDMYHMDFEGLRDMVVQMFAGARCVVDIDTFQNDMTSFKSRDDVLIALIHLGYLAYNVNTREVYVPNEEVRTAFARAVKDTDWEPAMIVELKYGKPAQSAIAQIKEKNYPEVLRK